MQPAGQKDEPFSAKERRPLKCPSQVGKDWRGWRWGSGESPTELGRMVGSQRSGLCCESGSYLDETLVPLESWVCSSGPGHT